MCHQYENLINIWNFVFLIHNKWNWCLSFDFIRKFMFFNLYSIDFDLLKKYPGLYKVFMSYNEQKVYIKSYYSYSCQKF